MRVELNPTALNNYGIGLDDVRAALEHGQRARPKGDARDSDSAWRSTRNRPASSGRRIRPLIVAYRNGAPVRLADVATVEDSVEDRRDAGLANGKPAVLIIIFRQPGANIIETVDRVRALCPELRASIPPPSMSAS